MQNLDNKNGFYRNFVNKWCFVIKYIYNLNSELIVNYAILLDCKQSLFISNNFK